MIRVIRVIRANRAMEVIRMIRALNRRKENTQIGSHCGQGLEWD